MDLTIDSDKSEEDDGSDSDTSFKQNRSKRKRLKRTKSSNKTHNSENLSGISEDEVYQFNSSSKVPEMRKNVNPGNSPFMKINTKSFSKNLSKNENALSAVRKEPFQPRILKNRKRSPSRITQDLTLPIISNVQGGIRPDFVVHDANKTVSLQKPVAQGTTSFSNDSKTFKPTGNLVMAPTFLPDQVLSQIVQALGLSVKDIEKHGGTVAITIPEGLIHNGILDLNKLSSAKQSVDVGKASPQLIAMASNPMTVTSEKTNFAKVYRKYIGLGKVSGIKIYILNPLCFRMIQLFVARR